MKILIWLAVLSATGAAHASCNDEIVTYTNHQLSTSRLDKLAGQRVTIVNEHTPRTLNGIVIVAYRVGARGDQHLGLRVLDDATGEVTILDYESLRLGSITAHGVADEIRAVEHRPDVGLNVRHPAIFRPYDSNIDCLRRDFDVRRPVTLIVAAEGAARLETIDGLLALPARSAREDHYVTVETTAGPRRVHQLRIIAAYGSGLNF